MDNLWYNYIRIILGLFFITALAAFPNLGGDTDCYRKMKMLTADISLEKLMKFNFMMTIPGYVAFIRIAPAVGRLCLAVSAVLCITVFIYLKLRVFYDDDRIVVKRFFRTRVYSYGDITAFGEDLYSRYICFGDDTVRIGSLAAYQKFSYSADLKYAKLHDGETIPRIQIEKQSFFSRTANRIFRGNVYGAGSYISGYMSVLAMIAILGYIIIRIFWLEPYAPGNTDERQVSFKSCTSIGKEAVLQSADDTEYRIPLTGTVDIRELQALCYRMTPVTVYVTEVKTYNGFFSHYGIKAMWFGGKYILSFEDMNIYRSRKGIPYIAVITAAAAVWLVYVILAAAVGRRPERYSEKVRRFFFKDNCLL